MPIRIKYIKKTDEIVSVKSFSTQRGRVKIKANITFTEACILLESTGEVLFSIKNTSPRYVKRRIRLNIMKISKDVYSVRTMRHNFLKPPKRIKLN